MFYIRLLLNFTERAKRKQASQQQVTDSRTHQLSPPTDSSPESVRVGLQLTQPRENKSLIVPDQPSTVMDRSVPLDFYTPPRPQRTAATGWKFCFEVLCSPILDVNSSN